MATKTKEAPVFNLFASAQKVETKTSTTKDKEKINVPGIENDLIRYHDLKTEESNIKAEKEIIAGRLREIGREKYLTKYRNEKRRPESFQLTDGKGKILFIVMDAYKKVEETKESELKQFPDVLETATVFTMNPELLEQYGGAISKAIANCKEIPDADKPKLLLRTESTRVKKGTIDRLMQYDKPELLFSLIEPTIALK